MVDEASWIVARADTSQDVSAGNGPDRARPYPARTWQSEPSPGVIGAVPKPTHPCRAVHAPLRLWAVRLTFAGAHFTLAVIRSEDTIGEYRLVC